MLMVNWLTDNWKLIAILGCIVIELIVLLLTKKRPEVIDNSFLVRLCEWIDYAESHFRIGLDKMDYVLQQAQKYLGEKYVEKDVKNMVEYVLTLPEKKEK